MTDYQYKDSDEEEHFLYLDELRESGATNMFGAGSYLQETFGMDRTTARATLAKWMETFGARHPRD